MKMLYVLCRKHEACGSDAVHCEYNINEWQYVHLLSQFQSPPALLNSP